MTQVISVRLPSEWAGRVTSGLAREWVTAWLSQPTTLQQAPVPGAFKLNLRLSKLEIAELRRTSGNSTSSAIRAILALHVSSTSEPQKRGIKWVIGGIASGIVLFLLVVTGVGPRGGNGR